MAVPSCRQCRMMMLSTTLNAMSPALHSCPRFRASYILGTTT